LIQVLIFYYPAAEGDPAYPAILQSIHNIKKKQDRQDRLRRQDEIII
jgi:hypothetical protein